MKNLLAFVLIAWCCVACASRVIPAGNNTCIVLMSYTSKCCGTAPNTLVHAAIRACLSRLKNNSAVLLVKSWGKEGEHDEVLRVKGLNAAERARLLQDIKVAATQAKASRREAGDIGASLLERHAETETAPPTEGWKTIQL